VDDARRIFTRYLKLKRLNSTRGREFVLEEVARQRGHFGATDLYVTALTKKKRASLSTIYRTLPMLVDCGLIRETGPSDSESKFEYIYGRECHDHLVCLRCGKIIEVQVESLGKSLQSIASNLSFRLREHYLEAAGYCEECLKDMSRGVGRKSLPRSSSREM
jgi:Fur family ferric uptake transcriptional regulator